MTRFIPLLMLSLAIVACTPSSTVGTPDAPPQRTPGMNKNPSGEDLLGGYRWRLQDATDAQGKRIDALLICPERPLEFDFADGRIAVRNACNDIGGDVRIDGDTVRIGTLVSTKMACEPPAMMALDSEIGKRLQGTPRIALPESDPRQLLWTAANGDILRFTGEPKAETRFGGPGETLFMEVAARSKPCPHPLTSSAQRCLEVRELRYNAQGLPLGKPGAWRLFHDRIEGYTHEEGIRNVLRVKRFSVDNAQNGAPTTAYVLDMAIESEMVGP